MNSKQVRGVGMAAEAVGRDGIGWGLEVGGVVVDFKSDYGEYKGHRSRGKVRSNFQATGGV